MVEAKVPMGKSPAKTRAKKVAVVGFGNFGTPHNDNRERGGD